MTREGLPSIWTNPPTLVALIGVFLGAIDLTVVATILPGMISDLGINTADIDRYIWVVNSYLIAYVVSIPLVGRLSDLLGPRPVFVAACLVFLAGSIWCARAESLQDLIVGRAIQGFGGGALLPIALAVAATTFTGPSRAQAVGAVGAIDTLGWVSGPAYGALLINQLTFVEEPWRIVFWINVPFAIALALAARLLPASTDQQSVQRSVASTLARLDIPGFALLSVFLVTINMALASGGEIGATAGRGLRAFGGTPNPLAGAIPYLLMAAAVAVFLLAIRVRHNAGSFIPKSLLTRSSFRASLFANAVLGTVLMAGMVNVPVIVALVETSTDTSIRSALLLAPFTLSITVSSVISGRLLRTRSSREITLTGLAFATIGNLAVFPILELFAYEWMALGLGIAGAGVGLALTPLSTTALDSSTSSSHGVAASTLLVFRLLGMTVGVSILTSLGVQRLQVLTGALEPIVRSADESTAAFLLRQQEFIISNAIPLGVQVVQETFLVAAVLTACAFLPARRLSNHVNQRALA